MRLVIERLGHLGDGIGADGAGRPVFAALTLPGEVVEGDVVADRMAQPKIVTPVAARVRPVCAHFKACGGCALQHASDAFVAEWKQQVVRVALAAQGLEAPMRPILTSPRHAAAGGAFGAAHQEGRDLGLSRPRLRHGGGGAGLPVVAPGPDGAVSGAGRDRADRRFAQG